MFIGYRRKPRMASVSVRQPDGSAQRSSAGTNRRSQKLGVKSIATAASVTLLLGTALAVNPFTPAPQAQAVEPSVAGIARTAAGEGIILLKNDDKVLPLSMDRTVSVFGRVQINTFFVGYGSGGDVRAPYRINFLTGLRRNPEITVNETLARVYENWAAQNVPDDGSWGNWPTSYPEMPLTNELVEAAAAESDTAVVIIGRSAGEDRESTNTPGSYQLTVAEKDMLAKVNAHFNKIAIVLNTGNLIDMGWIADYPNIKSVLYAWQGGMEAGSALADVLSGDVSPSGKLPQTIANKLSDYPTQPNFGNPDFNNYAEDIFVGYRYFETFAPEKVMYPFGYGLSYTDFSITTNSVTEAEGRITVDVTVKNTGDVRGKQVVQVYYGAPQGKLGKAAKSLIAYAKTAALQPGAIERIRLTFDIEDMASYDDGGYTVADGGSRYAWVLEAGDYPIYVGDSVRSAAQQGKHTEVATRVIEQLSEAAAPRVPFQRFHAQQGADGVELTTDQMTPGETPGRVKAELAADIQENSPDKPYNQGNKGIELIDVYNGTNTTDEFLSQLTLLDTANLVRGAGGMGHGFGIPGNASVYGGTNTTLRDTYGIPSMSTTDGPSGIRMSAPASLIPIGTLLSSTFNLRLVEQLYAAIGKEMVQNGSDALLAPGMNLQRDPLLGRNFEYFSEDPILTGTMGASTVRGVQSQGVSATPKHFAANNQETNRHHHDSRVSERALRELYLKGFEIVVETANPHNIMMAYNRLNGPYTWAHYDLAIKILRDQWGYTGVAMTDWWITANSPCADISLTSTTLIDNQCRIRGGTDVLMPGDRENEGPPQNAVTAGNMGIGELQRSASRVLDFAMKSAKFRQAHDLPLYTDLPEDLYFDIDQPEPTQPPRLNSLAVDGKPLEGFSPLTTEYVLYAKELTVPPVVSATADEEITVTITQATPTSPIATISAKAADGGETRYRIHWSDDPDLPLPDGAVRAIVQGLKINGETFLPFYQDIFNYTIPGIDPSQVTFSDIRTPRGVTATVLGPDVTGTFTVRAESADHRRDYHFAFPAVSNVFPQSDDFEGTTLKDFWTVDNQSDKFSKPDGSVQIITQDGEWYQNGTGLHNTVWQRADGAWTAVTKFHFDKRPFMSFHQLGIVIFQDKDNFLQLQLQYQNWDGLRPTPFNFALKNETNAVQSGEVIANAAPLYPDPGSGVAYMKVTKSSANVYRFFYSTDGITYTQIGGNVTKVMAEPKFGLQVHHSGAGITTDQGNGPTAGLPLEPITVNYDYVDFDVDHDDIPTLPTTFVLPVTPDAQAELRMGTHHFLRASGLQSETCSNGCSGQNLAYIEAGRWALYNLDVEKAGFYTIYPQMAANASPTAPDQIGFSVFINGERATNFVKGGGTGGWQNWVTLEPKVVLLKQGINKLRFVADTGGFNLSFLRLNWLSEAPEPEPTDKTALEAAVLAAESLDPSDFTPGSWAAVTKALDAARVLLGDEEATQEELDRATLNLNLALEGLVEIGDIEPVLTVSPETVAEGVAFAVRGSGFAPSEEVAVTVGSAAPVVVQTDAAGNFSRAFTAPPGTHTVKAIGVSSGVQVSASVTVEAKVYTPSITVDPTSVGPSGAFAVAGSGFAPFEEVTLRVTAAGADVGVSVVVAADAAGKFSRALNAPTAPGDYKVVAGGVVSLVEATTALKVVAPVYTPEVTVYPTSIDPGGVFSVFGSGFAAGEDVVVSVGGGDPVVVRADAAGGFGRVLVAPVGVGTHVVVALGGVSQVEARAFVRVTAAVFVPRLVVEPSVVDEGVAFAVRGSGFAPGEDVTVSVGGDSVVVRADAAGGFVRALTAVVGTHLVVAVGGVSQVEVRSAVTVVAPVFEPVLSVDPGVVVPGGVFTVRGEGFAVGESVTVTVGGDSVVVRADAAGGFARDLVAPVVPGVVEVTAEGSVSGVVVAGSLVVEPLEGWSVVRHWGKSRYETSLELLRSGTAGAPVFVATGVGFADALSAAPAAALVGGRVVLTHPRVVSGDLVAAIADLAPEDVYIVGGTGAVSVSVERALAGIDGVEVTRLAGASRYLTSLAIYDEFFAGEGFSEAFVATGRDYPDALVASAAAGAVGAPVVLVDGKASSVPVGVTDRLTADKVGLVLVAGGKGAVSVPIEQVLVDKVGQVKRLSGGDRLGTGIAINAWVDGKLGLGGVTDVYVATARAFPDALSAAAPAGDPSARLVLSNRDCLPKASVDAVNAYSSLRLLHLVGGTNALTDNVGKLKQCK